MKNERSLQTLEYENFEILLSMVMTADNAFDFRHWNLQLIKLTSFANYMSDVNKEADLIATHMKYIWQKKINDRKAAMGW